MINLQNLEKLKDINNWEEISDGYFKFTISNNVCYEIVINKKNLKSNILDNDVSASLFLTGSYVDNKNKESYFERELIISNKNIKECIKMI